MCLDKVVASGYGLHLLYPRKDLLLGQAQKCACCGRRQSIIDIVLSRDRNADSMFPLRCMKQGIHMIHMSCDRRSKKLLPLQTKEMLLHAQGICLLQFVVIPI